MGRIGPDELWRRAAIAVRSTFADGAPAGLALANRTPSRFLLVTGVDRSAIVRFGPSGEALIESFLEPMRELPDAWADLYDLEAMRYLHVDRVGSGRFLGVVGSEPLEDDGTDPGLELPGWDSAA